MNYFFCLILFFTTATLHAKTTFYVGLLGGSQSLTGAYKDTVYVKQTVKGHVEEFTSPEQKVHASAFGFQGGFLMGVDIPVWEDLFLGGAFSAEMGTAFLKKDFDITYYDDKGKEKADTYTLKSHQEFELIPAFQISYALTKAFRPYVSFGLGMRHIQVSLLGPKPIDGGTSEFQIGFVPQLGAFYKISRKISLLGQVSYGLYGAFTKDFEGKQKQRTIKHTLSSTIVSLGAKLGAAFKF